MHISSPASGTLDRDLRSLKTARSVATDLLGLWRSDDAAFGTSLADAMRKPGQGDVMLGLLLELADDDRFAILHDVVSVLTDRYLLVEDHAGDRACFREILFAMPVWGARSRIEAFLAASGQDLVARAMCEGELLGPMASVVMVPETQHLYSLFPDNLGKIGNLVENATDVVLGSRPAGPWTRAAAALFGEMAPPAMETSPELACEGDRDGPVFRMLFGLAGVLMPSELPEDGPDFLTGYPGEALSPENDLAATWTRIAGNVRRGYSITLGRPATFATAQDTVAANYARFVVEMMVLAERAFDPPGEISMHTCEDEDAILCAVVVDGELIGTFSIDIWMVPDEDAFVAELEDCCRVIWHEDFEAMPQS